MRVACGRLCLSVQLRERMCEHKTQTSTHALNKSTHTHARTWPHLLLTLHAARVALWGRRAWRRLRAAHVASLLVVTRLAGVLRPTRVLPGHNTWCACGWHEAQVVARGAMRRG